MTSFILTRLNRLIFSPRNDIDFMIRISVYPTKGNDIYTILGRRMPRSKISDNIKDVVK